MISIDDGVSWKAKMALEVKNSLTDWGMVLAGKIRFS